MTPLLAYVGPLLVAAILPSAAAEPPPPASTPAATTPQVPQGVPNVFRCIFEDQPRMVIIRPAADLWVAFNPATCTIDKIWRGGMKFRGKVWDFSQDNCAPSDDAVVWAERDRTLARLPDDGRVSAGWTLQGVEPLPEGGWRFAEPGASIISPPVDACAAMIAFDETGRESPLRIDVSLDGGATWAARSFLSTMHGTSDTDWQFNFRQLDVCDHPMQVRLSVAGGHTDKRLRKLRLTQGGPSPSTRSVERRLDTEWSFVWRGYERSVSKPNEVVLLYDAPHPPARIRHHLRAQTNATGLHLVETIDASDVPADQSFLLWGPRPSSAAAREYHGADASDDGRLEAISIGAVKLTIPPLDHKADRTVRIVTRPTLAETAP